MSGAWYRFGMRDALHLQRLVEELAELPPSERAQVLAEVNRRDRGYAPDKSFRPPTLTGGTAWVGGDLRRDELYGDDGR